MRLWLYRRISFYVPSRYVGASKIVNLPDGKHHNCHWSRAKYCSNMASSVKRLFIFVLKIPWGKMKYF
jgi:hypothetical protein